MSYIDFQPTSDLAEKAAPKPLEFTITPDTLSNAKDVKLVFIKHTNIYKYTYENQLVILFFIQKKTKIPYFKVSGKIDSTVCCIQKPLSGYVCVHLVLIIFMRNFKN